MKKKLIRNGRSKALILDKQLLELAHIDEWVEIIMEQDLIVIRRADAPLINGKKEYVS